MWDVSGDKIEGFLYLAFCQSLATPKYFLASCPPSQKKITYSILLKRTKRRKLDQVGSLNYGELIAVHG